MTSVPDATGVDMHPGQLAATVSTVRNLVAEQFPGWQGLPVTAVASQGTVNALFRIGAKYLAASGPTSGCCRAPRATS